MGIWIEALPKWSKYPGGIVVKVSMAKVDKKCKGTWANWKGHGQGFCESVGYDSSWGCRTLEVQTDGTPTLLYFGNFTNKIQTSKEDRFSPEGSHVITNYIDAFRITVEKNSSTKNHPLYPLLMLALANLMMHCSL